MEVDPAVVVAAPGPAFAAGPPATPGPAHAALGGTPATTTVPRESPSQIKDLHFSVVYGNFDIIGSIHPAVLTSMPPPASRGMSSLLFFLLFLFLLFSRQVT